MIEQHAHSVCLHPIVTPQDGSIAVCKLSDGKPLRHWQVRSSLPGLRTTCRKFNRSFALALAHRAQLAHMQHVLAGCCAAGACNPSFAPLPG